MNQSIYSIYMFWGSSKSNKSLRTWEPNRFLGIEPAGLTSQVDPTSDLINWQGKLLNFLYMIKMALPMYMYLGDYVEDSIHEKYPANSKYYSKYINNMILTTHWSKCPWPMINIFSCLANADHWSLAHSGKCLLRRKLPNMCVHSAFLYL